ncbi:unnamed protein product [Urochloa humidicola]
MLLPFLLQSLLLTCFFSSFVHPMEPSTSRCSNISNVSIPYPFGIAGKSRFLSQGFRISCGSRSNISGPGGPVLSIGDNVFGILDISLLDGFMTILASINSQQCRGNSSINLERTVFTFSDTRNKFTALGCNVVAMLLNGSSGYSGGCASFCSTKDNIVSGSCSGVACCQAPVPKGLKKLELEFGIISNKDSNTLPCDGGSCEEAKQTTSYACRENTYCYNSSNGIGYRCNCSQGFEGNPYLQGPDGCQDIDECSTRNPCTHNCINTNGSFQCSCPAGMSGDGLREGSGCNGVGTLVIAVVIGLALLVLLFVLSFWTHWLVKKRKLSKRRQKYFMQNGGLLLK